MWSCVSGGELSDRPKDWTGAMLWWIWFLLKVFTLCYCCEISVEEATKSAQILQKCKIALQHQSVDNLSKQSPYQRNVHRKIAQFTCIGLFDISRTTFFAVITQRLTRRWGPPGAQNSGDFGDVLVMVAPSVG
uniref:(northern house mosquito) hypothetical protein n=1 Tax=Culex pipiens TaxID=7175 RepID=A0A8D7ZXD5_CULPI